MNYRLNSASRGLFAGAAVAMAAMVCGSAFPVPMRAQSPAGAAAANNEVQAAKSFEVASIKPSAEDGRRVMIGISPGGRFTARGVNIKFLIQQAYGIKDFQIIGAPGWLTSERYDVIAKAETPDFNREKLEPLLQSLLAERCNLKFHRETRELPIYYLVVGKYEPKLQRSEIGIEGPRGDPPSKAGQAAEPPGSPQAAAGTEPRKKASSVRVGRGQIDGQMTTLSDLASLLAQQLGRPVIDKTGIAGLYDIKLEWTPDETMRGIGLPGGETPGQESSAPIDTSGPSIFAALQEQLGLKLESHKGPVEIIVLDHIERPSEN